MAESLEQRKRRLYSAMSHEELVEEIIKRDDKEDKTTIREAANEVSRDELVKTLGKCILKKLETDENIIKTILVRTQDYGSYKQEAPTPFLEGLFREALKDNFYKEFQDGLAAYIKEHYKELCERVMRDTFMEGLKNNNIFRSAVSDIVYDIDR
jgi:hypothetical protein